MPLDGVVLDGRMAVEADVLHEGPKNVCKNTFAARISLGYSDVIYAIETASIARNTPELA
jgi:hypothetical protein